MQKPLLRFGSLLLLLAIVCFFVVRSNLRDEHRRQAEVWAQMGRPDNAPSPEVGFDELFKFEQMKGTTQILGYAGVALGAAGVLCLLGGIAAAMTARPKPLPPPKA